MSDSPALSPACDRPHPAPSERARVRRAADRGHYDAPTLRAIVDQAQICHVAFAAPDPICMPTACWRIDDRLYIHGSNGSRMILSLAAGAQACVAITHLDGLVLAKSAFSHSMNYRSVLIHGRFDVVSDEAKPHAFAALMEHMVAGRTADCRPPDPNELAATTVLAIPLEEAAAKIRAWGPRDRDADMALPHWSGVLPLATARGRPQGVALSNAQLPAYLDAWWGARVPDPVQGV